MRPEVGEVHRAHLLHIAGAPALADARAHLTSIPDGALAVGADGVIAYCGTYDALPQEFTGWQVVDRRGCFVLPGFVDTHIHFPQTYAVDSYGGGQLLEWLDNCIFPAESRYRDTDFAARAAVDFCRRRIAAGTTSALVFGSAFPAAQEALFAATERVGLRIVSGRGIQTAGPPSAAALVTDVDTAIARCADEIDRWHGRELTDVALVPRFSLSVTPHTLAAIGELYDDVRGRGVYFHSHLNENDRPGTGEVAATRSMYGTDTYLDTYDGRFLPGSAVGGSSLLGRRSVLAHAVHCTDGELARMAETQTSIAHCPTSQQFLGSGTMPWTRTVDAGITVALGSDVGAGDEWLIAKVAADCFKVHMSEPGAAGVSLHPAELLFGMTLAGARALDREESFGNLDVGKDADFLVVDPQRWEPLARMLEHGERADDDETATAQMLFALILGMREPAIAEVFVRGRRVVAEDIRG